MKYELVNCKIVTEGDEVNGRHAQATYLATTAVSERNSDNGFSLPMFNPSFIAAARYCIQNELSIDKYLTDFLNSKGAVIEERTVKLPSVYFRRAQGTDGKLLNEPVKDKNTGKPIPYDSLRIHCIYSMPMEDAYDPVTGVILMEQDYRENGTPFMRPKRKYIMDEATGRPKREYWQGWSAIERRDQILASFYMPAPPEYQTITGPEVQQPAQQSQQQPGQAQQNPFNNIDPVTGQTAQPQVADPMS